MDESIVELKNAQGGISCRIWYRSERNYLFVEWLGYTIRQNIIDGGLAQIAWAEKHAGRLGCKALVNDNRQLRGSWEAAVGWVDGVRNPRIYELGFRRSAIVLSPDLFTQVSAEAMAATSAPGKIETQVFRTLEAAEQWVAELHREPAR